MKSCNECTHKEAFQHVLKCTVNVSVFFICPFNRKEHFLMKLSCCFFLLPSFDLFFYSNNMPGIGTRIQYEPEPSFCFQGQKWTFKLKNQNWWNLNYIICSCICSLKRLICLSFSLRELSSRHQTSVPFRNTRESKLIWHWRRETNTMEQVINCIKCLH